MTNIGVMYEYGYGVDKDPKRAVEYYQKAADMGNAAGQANLASMYRDGNGVQKDYAKAAYWYNECVNNPNADEKIIKDASEQLENPNVKAALK